MEKRFVLHSAAPSFCTHATRTLVIQTSYVNPFNSLQDTQAADIYSSNGDTKKMERTGAVALKLRLEPEVTSTVRGKIKAGTDLKGEQQPKVCA